MGPSNRIHFPALRVPISALALDATEGRLYVYVCVTFGMVQKDLFSSSFSSHSSFLSHKPLARDDARLFIRPG